MEISLQLITQFKIYLLFSMINSFKHSSNQHYLSQPQLPLHQVIYSNQKLQHINMIIPPTTNLGGVYIGDTVSILKPETIEEKKIMAVLSCNQQGFNNLNRIPSKITFKFMEMQDHLDYPIQIHFDTAYDFIDKNRNQGKNVLVQCHAGVSRSSTLICAYLIKKHKIRAEEALRLVKEKRPRAKPNQGFWNKLQEFAKNIQNQEIKGYNPQSDKKVDNRRDNEEDLPSTKVSFKSPIKFGSQKQFPSSAQKVLNSPNEEKQVKMSLDVPSQIQPMTTGHRISFSGSRCDVSPYMKMNEYPLKMNQKPLIVNKTVKNEHFYRNPLLTPQKYETRHQLSPSKQINLTGWSRHLSADKDLRIK